MKAPTTAQQVALISVAVSGVLAALKITVGSITGSASVLADGFESAGDVVASAIVFVGLYMASRPPDDNHPYGHGRLETLSGFIVGLILASGGFFICFTSLRGVYDVHAPPPAYAALPLVFSVMCKSTLTVWKYRQAKKTRSAGLKADAFNDAVDIVSGCVALTALGLTLYDPSRFLAADHFGGLGVGIIVAFLGLHVLRDTTMQLMDTMPEDSAMAEIRTAAQAVPGVHAVEKCFARKTGLQYHVDLHLEVNADLTVRQSHEIAGEVRRRVKQELPWVADVLVHVEPDDLGRV